MNPAQWQIVATDHDGYQHTAARAATPGRLLADWLDVMREPHDWLERWTLEHAFDPSEFTDEWYVTTSADLDEAHRVGPLNSYQRRAFGRIVDEYPQP
jgi:hypothetical protein